MTNLTHNFEQPRAHHQENQLYQYSVRYMSLSRWPSGMQVGKDLHSRRPLTMSDIYQTLYWYNWFSWWWARGCSKHVEDWNKYIRKKNCASSWSFTIDLYRDARSTEHKKTDISWSSSVPLFKCFYSASNYTTTCSFHILCDWLFAN
jgi:hypothetical protein